MYFIEATQWEEELQLTLLERTDGCADVAVGSLAEVRHARAPVTHIHWYNKMVHATRPAAQVNQSALSDIRTAGTTNSVCL